MYNQNKEYNSIIAYTNPSMHSIFDQRQSDITGQVQDRLYSSNIGRGRGSVQNKNNNNKEQRTGYGFVGIRTPLHSTRYQKTNKQLYNKVYNNNPIRSTKDKYRKKEIIRNNIKPNEILMKGNGSIQEYVDDALSLLTSNNSLIYITATGRSIGKAINCVEIIKRKQYGLCQESRIEKIQICEIWEPIEMFLKNVIVEHEVIYIKILLTFNCELVNMNSIGYQQPISWIDLGDARELYNKMSDKMGKLQNKYDIQEEELYKIKQEQTNDFIIWKINKVKQNIIDDQRKNYNEMKLKMDTMSINMENKYDTQIEIMKENKLKFDELQRKYDKLQKDNKDKEEQGKKKNYNHLNAYELVELIININLSKYNKYADTLLKGFIDEGVDGSCLHELTKEDLYRFGVIHFKDELAIYKAIKNL